MKYHFHDFENRKVKSWMHKEFKKFIKKINGNGKRIVLTECITPDYMFNTLYTIEEGMIRISHWYYSKKEPIFRFIFAWCQEMNYSHETLEKELTEKF